MNASNSTISKNHQEKMIVWAWSLRAVIALLTLFGNSFVMAFILKYRKLQVIPNAYIFSLALADFLVGAVVTPTDYACTFWYTCEMPTLRTTYDILIHLSVTNLCALTFDRYMAVVQPLLYHSFMNKGQVALILVFTWSIAAVLPVAGHICLEEEYYLTAKILRVVDMVFLLVLPPALLALAYSRMVYIARQHEKTVKIQHSQLSFNYGNSSLITKHSNKHGDSRERASVRMIGAVIIVFLLCYGLATFRSLYFYIMGRNIPGVVTDISRILLLTNSSVNFLVYAFLKKDFRQEIKRLCKHTRRTFKESFTLKDLLSK